jgi:hypothetical protein
VTFFADLTPYTYLHPEEDPPNTVNIGWIDRWHPFPTGDTSAEFQARLERLCQGRVKQTRGFYSCDFCKGRDKPHSSAEMRVADAGKIYAAPLLVSHYVAAHRYLPPAEFIAAVLAWDG